MRQLLSILKLGTSNKNYPPYSPFLHSDGERLYTCNMSESVCVDHKAPFNGDVNFFVLQGILNKLEDVKIKQKDSAVLIANKHTKHEIVIEDVNFPYKSIVKPTFDYIPLAQEMIDILKIAIKYATGLNVYSKVYIDKDYIISFGHDILFLRKIKTNFNEKIGIDKKIISVLTEGCSVGSVDDNFVVEFDGGFIVFETDPISSFNDDLIKKFFKNRRKNTEKLCSLFDLKEAVSKISPIFYGEKSQIINLMNKSKNLTVVGESMLNGTSKTSFPSQCKDPFAIDINAVLLNSINESFDVYISKDYTDCLYLTDGNKNEIIIRKVTEI